MIKNKLIYQSNELTTTHIPFTVIESNIFIILISRLKSDVFEYQFGIKEIQNILNVEDNNKSLIIRAIESLSDKSFYIKSKERTIKVSILDSINYPNNDNVKNQYVKLTLSRSIIPYLYNLKSQFTIFELNYYLKLKSTYSKKLYTLLAKYKTIGYFVISIEELQYILGVNFNSVGGFNQRVIQPSIKEITDITNIKIIEIKNIKEGKKIKGYRFDFKFKNIQLEIPCLPTALNINEELYNRLIKEFQLSNYQSLRIVTDVKEKDIRLTIREVQMSNPVSIGAYSINLFNRKYNLKL